MAQPLRMPRCFGVTLQPTVEEKEPARLVFAPGPQAPPTVGPNVEPGSQGCETMVNGFSGWADRLLREFGGGERPDLRRRFFAKVERLLVVHGDRMLRLVATARMQSFGKSNRGTYFCASLQRKICEAGLHEQGVADVW